MFGEHFFFERGARVAQASLKLVIEIRMPLIYQRVA